MAVVVQKIANVAYKTFTEFAHSGSTGTLHQSIPKLKDILNTVTSKDVCFDERLVTKNETCDSSHEGDSAPVTYIHLWEDTVMTIGMFVLKSGVTIPLHDHPRMYGLVKVIHGTAYVKSYSEARTPPKTLPLDIQKKVPLAERNRLKTVMKSFEGYLHKDSEPCLLTPNDDNFHVLTSVDGPAAFIDILSPPYDHRRQSRECHYYRELPSTSDDEAENQSKYSFLLQIPQPWEFWCDSAPYRGPTLYPYDDK